MGCKLFRLVEISNLLILLREAFVPPSSHSSPTPDQSLTPDQTPAPGQSSAPSQSPVLYRFPLPCESPSSDRSSASIHYPVPEQSSLADLSPVSNVENNSTSHNKSSGDSGFFVFRIDEFTEHPQAIQQFDGSGRWCPVAIPGYNIRINGGVSGQWYHCDNQKIRLLSQWRPADGEAPYKTFSTIYSDGHGFHVLRGDATNPPQSETWQDLSFDWDETTLSSALTNAGANRSLRLHNPNARWPRMLLPDIYHGPEYPESHYGGLRGDLPIFLALIALSMRPELLSTQLPKMMVNGEWVEHERSHGRK
jgi:hypothetical protein